MPPIPGFADSYYAEPGTLEHENLVQRAQQGEFTHAIGALINSHALDLFVAPGVDPKSACFPLIMETGCAYIASDVRWAKDR